MDTIYRVIHNEGKTCDSRPYYRAVVVDCGYGAIVAVNVCIVFVYTLNIDTAFRWWLFDKSTQTIPFI